MKRARPTASLISSPTLRPLPNRKHRPCPIPNRSVPARRCSPKSQRARLTRSPTLPTPAKPETPAMPDTEPFGPEKGKTDTKPDVADSCQAGNTGRARKAETRAGTEARAEAGSERHADRNRIHPRCRRSRSPSRSRKSAGREARFQARRGRWSAAGPVISGC